jgi:hypothetical protein
LPDDAIAWVQHCACQKPKELGYSYELWTYTVPSGQTTRYSASDSGKGIAQSEVDRVFEPFFTTKPEGLGMGLSISRSIVQAHGELDGTVTLPIGPNLQPMWAGMGREQRRGRSHIPVRLGRRHSRLRQLHNNASVSLSRR